VAKEKFTESREEIAEILGVEVRTITNWIKHHPDFPSRVDGKHRKFPIARCVTWKIDRAVADAIASMAPKAPADLADAEKRRAIADAEFAEIRVQKLRGEVVLVEDARKEVEAAFARVRARFVAIPGEYAPRFLNLTSVPQAVSNLRDLTSTVLSELQQTQLADEDDTPDVDDNAAGSGDGNDLDQTGA
jgi:phage terminase Nu1 subunit (DNA packaging protein)